MFALKLDVAGAICRAPTRTVCRPQSLSPLRWLPRSISAKWGC